MNIVEKYKQKMDEAKNSLAELTIMEAMHHGADMDAEELASDLAKIYDLKK